MEIVRQSLNCTLCQQLFKSPVFLSCGHTFCHQCIHQHGSTSIDCPICHQPSFVVFSLPANVVAAQIVGIIYEHGWSNDIIDEVRCPSCKDDAISEGAPRILQHCGHTVCEHCLMSRKQGDGSGVACPVCRSVSHQYPVNHQLVDIFPLAAARRQARPLLVIINQQLVQLVQLTALAERTIWSLTVGRKLVEMLAVRCQLASLNDKANKMRATLSRTDSSQHPIKANVEELRIEVVLVSGRLRHAMRDLIQQRHTLGNFI